MKKFRELMEASETMVFAYGRFNPPTTGHEKLIQKVVSVAGSNDYRIYPSHSQNPKRDPLPQALKTAYMRKMFRKYARNIVVTKSRNAIEIAVELYDLGYKNLIMIAGSDRVKVFDAMLNQYNGVEGKKHGYYKFDSIEIVSAGERDPDSEGVEGMSASKMRAAASDGNYDDFIKGLPSGFSDSKKLYRDVRKHMGIREERDMGDDYDSLRDAYLTGKIWNVGEIIEAKGLTGEVVRKGTNYLSFMTEDSKVHKAWLHEIELDERNYAKEYANYQGKPEQIARRSSRNKARRIMGDKTKIGMDVGHADNDPMNNDPKNLRNEDPSVNRREPRLREKRDAGYPDDSVKIGKKHYIMYKDRGSWWANEVDKKGNTIGDGIFDSSKKELVKILAKEGKLPPHLAKFFDKKGNMKPDAAKRVQKGRTKRGVKITDKTPKGYGPNEQSDAQIKSYIDDIVYQMISPAHKNLAKYKDKFRKHAYKTMDPRQSLDAVLPSSIKDKQKANLLNMEFELDELWYNDLLAKISQITHPRGWGKMIKHFADGMKDPEHRKRPGHWANEVARQYKGVDGGQLVKYINKLVDKGKLPKELKAEYEIQTFKSFVDQINNK